MLHATDTNNPMLTLSRFMSGHSINFKDDALCNSWARVGEMLVTLGTTFGQRYEDFSKEDQATAMFAARVMLGIQAMPAQYDFKLFDDRLDVNHRAARNRSARMSKALNREKTLAKKEAPKATKTKRKIPEMA
jgi:hypothetical protein